VSKGNVNKWKLLDLFSGAGGLSNGFEQTGNFEVIGAVENNEAAAKTYILNHDNDQNIILKSKINGTSDITKIDFRKLLNDKGIDASEVVILGGPPCQGFSNANRQRNQLVSGNNLLVKEFARAVYEIRPVAFLMENVKTMTSDVHKFFVQTDTGEKDFKKPSCRRSHLEWLNQQSIEKKIKLKKEDITILNYDKQDVPFEWASYLKENHKNIEYVLSDEEAVSLLRSLERRARKDGYYSTTTTTRNQLKHLVNGLKISNETPWEGFLSGVIKSLFKPLIDGETLQLKDFHPSLIKIVTLNTAIGNLKELEKNQIDIDTITLDTDKKVLKVHVTTYNVVEYLKAYFTQIGYELDSRVLTASDFGVPQKRNRFFILGVTEDNLKSGTKVKLPAKNFNQEYTVHDAIKDLEEHTPDTDIKRDKMNYKPSYVDSPLLKYYRSGLDSDIIYNHVNTDSRNQIKIRFKAIKERGGRNSKDVMELFEQGYSKVENIQNTVYLRLDYEKPSPTVVNVRKSMWSHPEQARAISIREAARLQSFKDSFRFAGKKDNQYQQIGNAVPPLLARAIAEQLLFFLGDKPNIPLNIEFQLKEQGNKKERQSNTINN
jgi:DNA (cytosine-5)-methyltransferase 1